MTTTNTQRKIFITIIAILLTANICMLVFILKSKDSGEVKRPERKEQIAAFLKNEIGFSQQQLQQFDSVSKWQKITMELLNDSARKKKAVELQLLAAANFSDTAIEKAIAKSCTLQMPVEKQLLIYIRSIRQLCLPGQLPAFDSLYVKVFNRRGYGKRKN